MRSCAMPSASRRAANAPSDERSSRSTIRTLSPALPQGGGRIALDATERSSAFSAPSVSAETRKPALSSAPSSQAAAVRAVIAIACSSRAYARPFTTGFQSTSMSARDSAASSAARLAPRRTPTKQSLVRPLSASAWSAAAWMLPRQSPRRSGAPSSPAESPVPW
jgi:hypothetical protein